ncbi:hypothetical protein SAMN05444920_102830 [Nonomuraea solani]|uniref:Uncharacterized protein n=1 Tax=Nonomuraea solani TaxID=1144553 RepID=A0A1H5ZQQ3_9ACTN|nr:hypothetical protein [Nonomuraea solani]SEG38883.1 hypothetical protein SAMN05444920_102830 [Nonomuraea solani]
MSNYTEDDLRTVFAEHSTRDGGRPPELDDIRRRGTRARRRRRTTAGAVLAGAAAAVAILAGTQPFGLGADPVTGSSARVVTGPGLPRTVNDSIGGPVSLIHSETHRSWGQGVQVVFQPTTVNTGTAIRCADPETWVLVRSIDDKEGWSDFGRCGDRKGPVLDSQYDTRSIQPGWLERPQGIEIWMFPADAPIAGGGDGPGAGCKAADRREGRCEGRPWDHESVGTMPEGLAAQLGGPGEGAEWSVGIYDRRP